MGLFGSAKSGETHDIQVTLASTGDGATTLIVNGLPYGTATRGRTKDQDSILVNEALSEKQKAEALCGLVAVMTGETAEEIAKLIGSFRKWREDKA